jgi:hypothetical protein
MIDRCNSAWWKNGVRVARCFYPAGHELLTGEDEPDPRHHNGTRTWRTFDNRWRTYTTAEMVEKLRVLTVRPPWAWAVAWAGKDVENRPTQTAYRGDVVVLAGKTEDPEFDSEAIASPRHPQMSRLWSAATDPRLTGEQVVASDEAWLARGKTLCVVRIADCHRAEPGCCDSPWAEYNTGWPFHWCLADLRRLSPLLDARGNLGLPKPDPDLADAIGAQLAA